MANERIFGQAADTQLLDSLGVFSMVDKTQRAEFINSTVSEINSAYKQLHELQMGYLSQQHLQRVKNEAELIDMQIKSIRVLSKDYDDIYRKRLDHLQKEVDKTVQMSRNKRFSDIQGIKEEYSFIREEQEKKYKNDQKLAKLSDDYINSLYIKQNKQQENFAKRHAEAAKNAAETAWETFKQRAEEEGLNVNADIEKRIKNDTQQKYLDDQKQILDNAVSKTQDVLNFALDKFNKYLSPLLGLEAYGKKDLSGSLKSGNQLTYDIRHQYGMFGMDSLTNISEGMIDSYKTMKQRGLIVDPFVISKAVDSLRTMVNLQALSSEKVSKLSETVSLMRESGVNIDINSPAMQSIIQNTAGAKERELVELPADIVQTFGVLSKQYPLLTEDVIKPIFAERNAYYQVSAVTGMDPEALRQTYEDLAQAAGFMTSFTNDKGVAFFDSLQASSVIKDVIDMIAGMEDMDVVARRQVMSNAGFSDATVNLFGEDLYKNVDKAVLAVLSDSEFVDTLANIQDPLVKSAIQKSGLLLSDESMGIATKFSMMTDEQKAQFSEGMSNAVAESVSEEQRNQYMLDSQAKLTEIDKANVKDIATGWINSSDYENTFQEFCALSIQYMDDIWNDVSGLFNLFNDGNGTGGIIGQALGTFLGVSAGKNLLTGLVGAGGTAAVGGGIGAALSAALPVVLPVTAAAAAIAVAVTNWNEAKDAAESEDDEYEKDALDRIANSAEETFIGIQRSVYYDENHNPITESKEVFVPLFKNLSEEQKDALKAQGINNEEQYLEAERKKLEEQNNKVDKVLQEELINELNVFSSDYWTNDKGKFDWWALVNTIGGFATGTLGSGGFKGFVDGMQYAGDTRGFNQIQNKYSKYNKFITDNPNSKASDLVSMYTNLGLIPDEKTKEKFFSNFAQYYYDYYDSTHEPLGDDSRKIWNIKQGVSDDAIMYRTPDGGTYASGISAVPYNGFQATLHQGEMVIPSKKANYIRALFGQKPLPTSGVPETQLTGSNSFVQSIPDYTQGQTPMGPQDDSGMSFAYGDDAVNVMKKMAAQGVTYNQMDCSDCVSDAYIKAGVGVPDSNCRGIYKWDQYGFGFIYDAKKNNGSLLSKQGLSQLSILPGDVILMDLDSSDNTYPDHVSLATGGGKMIHSYTSWDLNGIGGPHESGYWNNVVAVLRYGSGGTGESTLDLSNINYVSGNSNMRFNTGSGVPNFGVGTVTDLASAQSAFNNLLNFYGYGDFLSLYTAIINGNSVASYNGTIGGGNGIAGSTNYPITGNLTDGSALESNTYRDLIYKYSEKHGLDPRIVYGMIMAESSGNPNAISSGGNGSYKGLMQVDQDKVNALFGNGANIFDPETNIATGTNYLKNCIEKTGSVVTGVGGYNAGPGYEAWKNLSNAIKNAEQGQDLASIMQAGGFLVVSDRKDMRGNPKNIKTSYLSNVYKHAGYPLQVPYLAKGGIVDSPTLAMIGEGANNEAVTPLNKDNQLLGLDSMTNSLLDGMDELCGHILNKLNEVISAINSINTSGGNIQRAQEATRRARQFRQSSMGNIGY